MKPRPTSIAILVCALAGAVPGTAAAQSNDPSPDSPSGKVYELPFDSARKDAAPRHNGSGAPSGGPVSSIHSDNGFGSSSTVPGTTGATGGTASEQNPASSQSSGGGSTSSQGSGGSGGKSGGGKGGGGSSRTSKKPPAAAGESQIPVAGVVREAAAGGSPSLWRSGLLLALGVLVAAGLAIAARVASRRR